MTSGRAHASLNYRLATFIHRLPIKFSPARLDNNDGRQSREVFLGVSLKTVYANRWNIKRERQPLRRS